MTKEISEHHGFVHPVQELSAFISESCRFEGKFVYEGFVRIDGVLKGEIFTHNILVIGSSGVVNAHVEANKVIIYGRFDGVINATKAVELKPNSRVHGTISSPLLIFEEGASFDGDIIGRG